MPLIKVVTTDTIEEIQMAHRSDILKLRVNLERIRNLSYMIIRREKLKRTWLQSHRDVVEKSLLYALGMHNPADALDSSSVTVKDEKKSSSTSPVCGNSSVDVKKSPSKGGSSYVTPVKSKGSPCPPNSPFIPEDTGLLVKNIISSSVIYEASDETQLELDRARVKHIMRELNRLTKINQLRRRVPNPYLREYTSKCANNIVASCSSDHSSATSSTSNSERSTNHCFRPSQEADEEGSPKAKANRGRNSSFENKGDLHHPLNGVFSSTRASPVKIKTEAGSSPSKSNSPSNDRKNPSDQLQMLNQVSRNQVSGSKSPTNQNHLLTNGHESLRVLNDHHHNNSSPSSSPICKKLTRSSLKGDFKKCNGLRSSDPHETEETNVIRKYF